MPRNFVPGSDSGLLSWSRNYAARVAAEPGHFTVSADMAARLVAAQAAFAQAYDASHNSRTRGPRATAVKNGCRAALIAEVRASARIIRSPVGATPTQMVSLGLTVRRKPRRRVPVPTTRPRLHVVAVQGNRFDLLLRPSLGGDPHESGGTRRKGRPVDVNGALVFRFVGPRPTPIQDPPPWCGRAEALSPTLSEGWVLASTTNQTRLTVALPATLRPGTMVWFAACWTNARAECGPVGTLTPTTLGYGGITLPQLNNLAA